MPAPGVPVHAGAGAQLLQAVCLAGETHGQPGGRLDLRARRERSAKSAWAAVIGTRWTRPSVELERNSNILENLLCSII